MDNLARNAMLAKQAGMSYGRWKALQKPVKSKKQPDHNMLTCPECGTEFRKGNQKQKYCSYYCQSHRAGRNYKLKKLAQAD